MPLRPACQRLQLGAAVAGPGVLPRLRLPSGGSCSGLGQAAAAPDAFAVKPARNAAASAAALALDSGSMDMLGSSMLLSSLVPGVHQMVSLHCQVLTG